MRLQFDRTCGSAKPFSVLRRLGAAAATISLFYASIAAADDAPGAWQIATSVSPLTDAKTVSGSLKSVEDLHNMLGYPQKATLVLRCSDGQINVYVAWPEVIHQDGESPFLSLPQAMVYTRVDGGPISVDWWTLADSRDAAGAFDTRASLRLLSRIEHAHKLVVRMTGQTVQDASFDLTGIEVVAAEVRATCGQAAAPPSSAALATFSQPVVAQTTLDPDRAFQAAQKALEADGYKVAKADPAVGLMQTEPRLLRLTTKDADCGKYAGLPYLIDKRASTRVTVRITRALGGLAISVAIDGQYDVAGQVKALTCTSKGTLEAALAGKVSAAFQTTP
jgi:hypothetical protein